MVGETCATPVIHAMIEAEGRLTPTPIEAREKTSSTTAHEMSTGTPPDLRIATRGTTEVASTPRVETTRTRETTENEITTNARRNRRTREVAKLAMTTTETKSDVT